MSKKTTLDNRQRLLNLLKQFAFRKVKVVLSSGKESNYYIDARTVTLLAEGAYLIARLFWEEIKGKDYEAVGGPTIGADPIVGALAILSFQEGVPLKTFIIRKIPKAHGRKRQVEGPKLTRGRKVLLIDDVVTTGSSLLEAVKIMRRQGLLVKEVMALIDRREGAREALAKVGCRLKSIFTIDDFIS